MNSWREAPHLFANGKFKFMYSKEILKLVNIDVLSAPKGYLLLLDDETGFTEPKWVDSEDCTLIARPISDMTDEELIEWQGANAKKLTTGERERLIKKVEASIEYNMQYRLIDTRLTDIGVYPGPQSHFETDDLIDSTTLTAKGE